MTLSSHVPYSKNSAKLMALLILLPAHNTNKTIAPLKELQTVKNLQKNKESNADPHLAMLCLRSTHFAQHSIPAEILKSRVFQTNLSTASKASLSLSADGSIKSKLQARQQQQKSHYDRTSRPLTAVYANDPVVYLTHTATNGNLVL